MVGSNLPSVLTPQEVAEYLKVDIQIVLMELENGKLLGFKVGGDWRSTDIAILDYIGKNETSSGIRGLYTVEQFDGNDVSSFKKIPPFEYRWPASTEQFEGGYETEKLISGHSYSFKIGFTNREAAGQLRRRIIVWRDNWPLVEFAGSNDYTSDGLLASIIKLRNGKQLRPLEKIPDEYRNFRIAKYDSIIKGPYASRNMAVIVNKDDLQAMLRHAIIRGKWKNLI
ncbi:MAG: hypothetical protein WC566_05215 [Dehalococcoidia bacterium]